MKILNIDIDCLNESNKKNSCIYSIRNKITNKHYIGSTISKYGIIYRFRRHMYNLRSGKHHSSKLQRAFDKYDKDFNLWEFSIIEEVDRDNFIRLEQFYIDKYNSYKDGYNSTPIAYICNIGKMKESHKISISKSMQIIKDDVVISIFNLYNSGKSYPEISKILNISRPTVSSIINKETHYSEIKIKYKLEKTFYKYIFYEVESNKFYKVNEFKSFCKEKNLKYKSIYNAYLGKYKNNIIYGWTVFNRDNLTLNSLRDRLSINNRVFKLYKNNNEITFKNVVEFCKKNKLNDLKIYHLLNGTIKGYKGYYNENNR